MTECLPTASLLFALVSILYLYVIVHLSTVIIRLVKSRKPKYTAGHGHLRGVRYGSRDEWIKECEEREQRKAEQRERDALHQQELKKNR